MHSTAIWGGEEERKSERGAEGGEREREIGEIAKEVAVKQVYFMKKRKMAQYNECGGKTLS